MHVRISALLLLALLATASAASVNFQVGVGPNQITLDPADRTQDGPNGEPGYHEQRIPITLSGRAQCNINPSGLPPASLQINGSSAQHVRTAYVDDDGQTKYHEGLAIYEIVKDDLNRTFPFQRSGSSWTLDTSGAELRIRSYTEHPRTSANQPDFMTKDLELILTFATDENGRISEEGTRQLETCFTGDQEADINSGRDVFTVRFPVEPDLSGIIHDGRNTDPDRRSPGPLLAPLALIGLAALRRKSE